MGGRAILLVIVGFATIFNVIGYKLNTLSVNAVDNVVDYMEETVAENIAMTGANLGANKVFLTEGWDEDIYNSSLYGGNLSVTLETIDAFRDIKMITSTGEFNGIEKEVQLIVKASNFSKFAYFSEYEPADIWWYDKDTVWGPMHVNTSLKIWGDPTFMGKVTAKKKLVQKKGSKPNFMGGYETGIDLTIPETGIDNLYTRADAAGHVFSGHSVVYLKFDGEDLLYKFASGDSYTRVDGRTLAPNGIIFVHGGNMKLEGVVDGKFTVACGMDDDKDGGTIYLTDDIVYSTDPLTDPNCDDILGICAEEEVWIADNVPNSNDININAAIYSETEGFGAENWDSRGFSGDINLAGGITQSWRKPVGAIKGDGFWKKYKYDERLMDVSPPGFPGTGGFEIVSWLQ